MLPLKQLKLSFFSDPSSAGSGGIPAELSCGSQWRLGGWCSMSTMCWSRFGEKPWAAKKWMWMMSKYVKMINPKQMSTDGVWTKLLAAMCFFGSGLGVSHSDNAARYVPWGERIQKDVENAWFMKKNIYKWWMFYTLNDPRIIVCRHSIAVMCS